MHDMKYQQLLDFLRFERADLVTLSFEQIALLVGGLPASAFKHPAWWANERCGTHSHAQAWMGAGRRTSHLDLVNRCVTFERTSVHLAVNAAS
jgi:hypothetical protein